MQEVLDLYAADDGLPFRCVKVTFIGELGHDQGGLTKDLFTSLWAELLKRYFTGCSAMVPYIPVHEHIRKRRFYVAIGRILAHTVALLQYVPARLSRCALLCLALDSSHVTEDLLLADLRYVTYFYRAT